MVWHMISGLQYPHWLMAAGSVLLVVGFVGSAFRKNKESVERPRFAPTETPYVPRPRTATQLPPSPFELDAGE